jgi:hypothetical protein
MPLVPRSSHEDRWRSVLEKRRKEGRDELPDAVVGAGVRGLRNTALGRELLNRFPAVALPRFRRGHRIKILSAHL